jgi:putative peptidoglycan lipid II flippase
MSESGASKSILLSFYTFLSRILGLVRDHFMAVSFGTGWVASAFSVAYRLPNMFRNLLAEGTLSQSFMPIYSDATKQSEEEAKVVSGVVLSFLFFILSSFVGLFLLLAPFLLPYLVGGTLEYSNLVIELSSILFILIMTASLASIFMAIANTKDKYFIPSLSPIILNLSYIISFLFILPYFDDLITKVRYLSLAIIAGGLIQLVVQAIYIAKLGLFPKLNFHWKHPAIAKIFQIMLPAVVGGGFYHISLLVDIFLANFIQNQNPGLGAVVSLDYAQRLVQFPTGIIGVALATTTLPTLLASLRKNDIQSVPDELANSLSFSLFLNIPASLCFIILGELIIDSLFYGGKWDHKATQTTLSPLLFYSMAIPMYSMNKILTSSYYAFKDTKHPLKVNMISFSSNIVMNLVLIWFLQHAGLALASALSATVTMLLLILGLKKHSIQIKFSKLYHLNKKLLIVNFVLLVLLLTYQFFINSSVLLFFSQFFSHANSSRLSLVVCMLPCITIYLIISHVLKLEQIQILTRKLRRR